MTESLCSSCGARIVVESAFCARCGAPVTGSAASPRPAGTAFPDRDFKLTASALGLFGRTLLLVGSVFLIAPAPWAFCWYYRWLVGQVQGRHGARLSFHGTPGSVWVLTTLYALLIVGGIAYNAVTASGDEQSAGAEAAFQIVNNLASVTLGWFFFRWIVGNMALDGRRLTLTASLARYFGWTILVMLSVLTIIGWAWASCAMYRWLAGTVEGAPGRFTFKAKGHQLLGRTILYILFIIPIVTMPWAIRWYMAWAVEQFQFQEAAEGGGLTV